MISAL